MRYATRETQIEVLSVDEFNPQHIFECGQVFCYKRYGDVFVCYPKDKLAVVYKNENKYIIECFFKEDIDFFINFFDLNINYLEIKEKINNLINKKDFIFNKNLIKNSLQFGYGIRILKQDILETIVSFIVSANNNIKRITKTLDLLREKAGEKISVDFSKINHLKEYETIVNDVFYSFPKLSNLEGLDVQIFKQIGAGYRAGQLVDTIGKLNKFLNDQKAETLEIRRQLIELKGIGRKVADCILLFGYGKKDVFPVDVWIKKVYLDMNNDNNLVNISADKISSILTLNFNDISGYIQQYLFYYKREVKSLQPR